MSTKRRTILAGAVFCNAMPKDEPGKINCSGIFTSFLAWAYPTSFRSWFAILTMHNVPEEGTSVTATISLGRGKKKILASADVGEDKKDVGSVLLLNLRHKFSREGLYMIHFNITGTTTVLKVPVKVTTKEWPSFTKKQLAFLKNNNAIPRSIRMNVECSACSHPYMFEESVLPDKPLAGGVLPFPESAFFECKSCGHELHLKDIQGQLRSSIKTALLGAMQGRK